MTTCSRYFLIFVGSSNSLLKLENTHVSAKILPCDESMRLRRKTALQTYVYSGKYMQLFIHII